MESQTPSRIRFLVVGLTAAMSVLLYLDRICPSFLEIYIREDLGLNDIEAGWFLSAFFWTYAIGQVPAGWLSDRFGARNMLSLYILIWSVCTGLMGLVESLGLVLLFRFGCGLGQAGGYPTSAGVVSKWVPFAARARASSIIATGGRIGGFAAGVLTAYLLVAFVPLSVSARFTAGDILDEEALRRKLQTVDKSPTGRVTAIIAGASFTSQGGVTSLLSLLNQVLQQRDLYQRVSLEDFPLSSEALRLAAIPKEQLSTSQMERRNRLLLEVAFPKEIRKIQGHGWRPTVLVYGFAGLVIAGGYWLGVRNRPLDHPWCNTAERNLIEEGRPAGLTNPHGRVAGLPLVYILKSRSMLLSSISQFCTNFAWVFLITLLPRYLTDALHVPVLKRGWMSGLPLLVGMAGMLTGGWLTDRLTRGLGLRWGRRLPMSLTRFMAMAAFASIPFLESAEGVTVAFCLVAISTDLGTASVWAFCQDVGGRHVGSVLGWGNMWGSAGAAFSPLVLTAIESGFGWGYAFAACALAFFISGVSALGVDATVPVDPHGSPSSRTPDK